MDHLSGPNGQAMTAEEAANARRAARFGIAYVAPVSSIDKEAREEIERRRQRAERFGLATSESLQSTAVAEKSHEIQQVALEQKRDVEDGEIMREDAVNCWPMDMLSTGEVVEYWTGFDVAVEWLNDSNCNVVFKDREHREKAIEIVCGGWDRSGEKDVNDIKDRITKEGITMKDTEMGGGVEEKVEDRYWARWRLGRVAEKGGFRLWVRAATNMDIRPRRPNPKSRWSRSVREKRIQSQSGGGLSIQDRLGLPLGSGPPLSGSVEKTSRNKRRRKKKTLHRADPASAELFRLDIEPGFKGDEDIIMKS